MRPRTIPSFVARRPGMVRAQRGVVLYVAIVMVVAMMLVGVGMLRSVGSGGAVAGNLAFKQNATLAAERGVEKAIRYLTSVSSTTLESDQTANGYFATWRAGSFDPLTFDWDAAGVQLATGDDGTGNKVRWVMHRLCSQTGSASPGGAQECARHGTTATGIGGGISAGVEQRILYRVTSRVDGPRNTVSYVQVVVY